MKKAQAWLLAGILLASLGAVVFVLSHRPTLRGITLDSVKNMAYNGHLLKNGRWTEPVSWNERKETIQEWWRGNAASPMDYRASRPEMGVQESTLGTFQGQPAAAVIYWESGGGSGSFTSVGLVVARDGQPQCVASADLGDRPQMRDLKFDHDHIVLEVLRVGENDSYAKPTDHVRLTYGWDGGNALNLISTEKLAPLP